MRKITLGLMSFMFVINIYASSDSSNLASHLGVVPGAYPSSAKTVKLSQLNSQVKNGGYLFISKPNGKACLLPFVATPNSQFGLMQMASQCASLNIPNNFGTIVGANYSNGVLKLVNNAQEMDCTSFSTPLL